MALPRPASPRALIADLRAFLAGRQRHQLIFAAISVMIPIIIVAGFYHDAGMDKPPPPPIIYVHDWPAARTDAEIIAQQKIDKAAKDKAAAESRAAYKRLADMIGMDTN
jgi:hypothetical protein